MDDYRVRHPIVLVGIGQSARYFSAAAGAQPRPPELCASGPIWQALSLQRARPDRRLRCRKPARQIVGTIESIRRALAAGGAYAPLQVTTYPVVNRDLASPIRLSFIGLKAKVADLAANGRAISPPAVRCKAGRTSPTGISAAPIRACSPHRSPTRAISSGRAPRTRPDTVFRTYAIDQIRAGKDPATTWTTKGTAINPIGRGVK